VSEFIYVNEEVGLPLF